MPAILSQPNFTEGKPVGHLALHRMLNLNRPLPAVRSYVVSGARRTRQELTHTIEYYQLRYAPEETLLGHLRFALKHEPCDLGILVAALTAIGKEALTDWIKKEPSGIYARRAWFLFEIFTGETLELLDTKVGTYTDALDPSLHFVGRAVKSPRHRVHDNLLGNSELCPTVRRTPKLDEMIAANLHNEVQSLTEEYPPETLARAVSFLYTAETRSSFAIEGEIPSKKREERFLQALHSLSDFNPLDKADLITLQNTIVDPRYSAGDYRDFQNFVGETTRRFGENVRFICPRPEDVPLLMAGWAKLTERILNSSLDPVVAAAVSAFAFVFIHPFEDGNGRLHRFLIHYVLNRRQYTPPGMIFPVSAAILRQKLLYIQTLDAFSQPVLRATDWEFTDDKEIVVTNDTRNLYRFFDATPQVEFLYDRIAETIREDFKDELDFLTVFDAAFSAVREVVDIPDRRATLLVRLLLQNQGKLAQGKRGQFTELTDDEIAQMEQAVLSLIQKMHG